MLTELGRGRQDHPEPVWWEQLMEHVLVPAVRDAGLEPIPVDPLELTLDPERLSLFPFGVAVVSAATQSVLRTVWRWEGARQTRAVLVCLTADCDGNPDEPDLISCTFDTEAPAAKGSATQAAITAKLTAERARRTSPVPLRHLLDGAPPVPPERYKTDLFRQHMVSPTPWSDGLLAARKANSPEAVRAVEACMAPVASAPTSAVVDLLLSYRAVSAWADVARLSEILQPPLARSAMIREQRAMALNRLGKADEAIHILEELVDERGDSSETLGLLGRVYKDRFDRARKDGEDDGARESLRAAIDAYARGFEADPRDLYPGVNAATLMELAEPPDPRRLAILPVIDYVLTSRLARRQADYWDLATRLEVAVLCRDGAMAQQSLAAAFAAVREPWEPRTTAGNLQMIDEARARRGERDPWLPRIIETLLNRAGGAPLTRSGGAPP